MLQKFKAKVIDYCKKNIFFRKIVRNVVYIRRCLHYKRFYLFNKVDEKTILFEVFGGRNYSCSPKYIYEKMITMPKFKDYTFVWSFKDIDAHEIKKTDNLILVKHASKEYYKYCASSKYWIVNSIMGEHIKKKKNQIYVQCWHGTPLKRLRNDIEVTGSVLNTIKEIRKRNDRDSSRFDYFLSPSKFATEKFTSAFNLNNLGKKDIIIEEGYPRNESLFTYTEEDVKRIKEKFGVPNDKKVIFYLPTFRDNQHTSGVGYTYSINIDFDRLKEKFSDKYVILFSAHYFVANSIDLSKYEGFVINANKKLDDINELYIISDIIMTDYSSVFFDFANLKRPMLFYMYDLDSYKNNLRDFYMDLDELPGPIAKTQEELEYNLENIEEISSKYKEKYKKFNEKFNYLDDKDATERVINKILKK
ncbi:MAG: CDP-glycerol glycerophosphotransferase family protein [Clostridia bacterium]|nr:CDP-glycerol glycerophosphotransferase family protein [Clostridia bacterium]